MNHLVLKAYNQIIGLVILGFILAACASAAAEQQPTPVPTELPPTDESSLQAALTANESNVAVQNEAGNELTLARFETVNVPPGDRIKLDEQGRGVLRFGDSNEVDLFGNTEIFLDELILEPGGSIFTRLKQIAGHTHLQLNEQSAVRVTLETEDSTIRTLERGTDFTVCFAPGKLTCIAVERGAIQVTSQSQQVTYKAGEATYYTPDQPPQPAICIQQDEFNDWLIQKRGPEEAQTLGQLVQSWPQEPCATEIFTSESISESTATATNFPETTATAPLVLETTQAPPTLTPTPTYTPSPTNTAKPRPTSTNTAKPKSKSKPPPTPAPP
jgi:hypothetical protein